MSDLDDLREERRIALEWINDARTASFLSFFVSVLVLLFSIWALGAYQGEIKTSDYTPITFSLSLLQTILALGALLGFWLIRGVAINKAKDVAETEAKRVAAQATQKHLADNHEREVNTALEQLFNTDSGKTLLVEAMGRPEVVAALIAAAQSMGLDLDKPPPSVTRISNPGKQPMGPENLNHLQTGFWKDISQKEISRFLNKSDDPPFEE